MTLRNYSAARLTRLDNFLHSLQVLVPLRLYVFSGVNSWPRLQCVLDLRKTAIASIKSGRGGFSILFFVSARSTVAPFFILFVITSHRNPNSLPHWVAVFVSPLN